MSRQTSMTHMSRRTALQLLAGSGAAGLTNLAELLARQAEVPGAQQSRPTADTLIVLWLAGGPSQLETFDPHPGRQISGPTKAISTPLKNVQLASGLERTAEQLESLALVRSLVSKEGDHERGTYLLKTGYRPDATAVHPAIGAICCHELPAGRTEIPRHVSILPDQWPARGGYLGPAFDAFKVADPAQRLTDVRSDVPAPRYQQRLADLAVLETNFAHGRSANKTGEHAQAVREARRLMTSEQLAAFDISQEAKPIRDAYGNTPFGRGCLAARRLVEVGVRCVEVTLAGWDSHVNNQEIHDRQKAILDPALAALVADLKRHELWRRSVVFCGGEFGRTPSINRLGGRDHWPHGFSALLGGGPIVGGQVIGATDPEGGRAVENPRQVGDLHATLLAALGIDRRKELITPAGRPLKLAEGSPIAGLLPAS